MMDLLAIIFIAFACCLNLVAMIALLKARDVFTMAHIAMIFNCYVVPICLIAIEIKRFSFISAFKITAIGVLNIIIANIVCYLIIQRASVNNIQPDAEIIETK